MGIATRSTRRLPGHTPSLEPSTYLTDGSQLFRVLKGFVGPPGGNFALLEECRSLEAIAFTPDEIWQMRLETVEPERC